MPHKNERLSWGGDRTTTCTAECEAMPDCTTCGRRKPPRGRSVPAEAANGYCHRDCQGFYEPPQPGHLWPGEGREE